jgi:hypothetical protein
LAATPTTTSSTAETTMPQRTRRGIAPSKDRPAHPAASAPTAAATSPARLPLPMSTTRPAAPPSPASSRPPGDAPTPAVAITLMARSANAAVYVLCPNGWSLRRENAADHPVPASARAETCGHHARRLAVRITPAATARPRSTVSRPTIWTSHRHANGARQTAAPDHAAGPDTPGASLSAAETTLPAASSHRPPSSSGPMRAPRHQPHAPTIATTPQP